MIHGVFSLASGEEQVCSALWDIASDANESLVVYAETAYSTGGVWTETFIRAISIGLPLWNATQEFGRFELEHNLQFEQMWNGSTNWVFIFPASITDEKASNFISDVNSVISLWNEKCYSQNDLSRRVTWREVQIAPFVKKRVRDPGTKWAYVHRTYRCGEGLFLSDNDASIKSLGQKMCGQLQFW